MKKCTNFILLFVFMAVAACSSLSPKEGVPAYPKDPEDVKRERAGSLGGEGGGLFKLGFGKKDDEGSGGGSGIGINSYLWRASLDTISFMPMSSADPFGGVIITDWYEAPEAKGERFKLNILILSKSLRADAIKVTAFKQTNKSGSWRDDKVNESVARDLENKILTRARELRVEKEGK